MPFSDYFNCFSKSAGSDYNTTFLTQISTLRAREDVESISLSDCIIIYTEGRPGREMLLPTDVNSVWDDDHECGLCRSGMKNPKAKKLP
ncbi:hypothetical protein EG329_010767, partial [Mollisiaceae sp. DMI_Dod_QoI]